MEWVDSREQHMEASRNRLLTKQVCLHQDTFHQEISHGSSVTYLDGT